VPEPIFVLNRLNALGILEAFTRGNVRISVGEGGRVGEWLGESMEVGKWVWYVVKIAFRAKVKSGLVLCE